MIFWAAIALGVILRLLNVGSADLATDEAQAALFATQAWPPLGMAILAAVQEVFGHTIAVTRGVSVIFGLASLLLFFLLARALQFERSGALLVATLASIFPSHILFSHLAYLSIQQSFFWLFLLYLLLRFRREKTSSLLIGVFLASVAATFVKPQGALLPALLLLGSLVESRRTLLKAVSCQLSAVLFLSLIPISLYLATSPGVGATALLYGGNMYGFSDLASRVVALVGMWWRVLGLFLIAMLLSLTALRTLPWPVHVLLFIGIAMGLVLGPGHEYYATDLVFFVLPIALFLCTLSLARRAAVLSALVVSTLWVLGPRILVEPGYWNTHATRLNEMLGNEEAVTVLGYAGHHLRWYLEPELLVGRDMRAPYPTGKILVLKGNESQDISGTLLYEDERLQLFQQ
jgi:4-amino-4-deoxy-L-arabinose transferase-like glycosyltransferase